MIQAHPGDHRRGQVAGRVIIHPLPERLATLAPHYQGMATAWTDLLAGYSDPAARTVPGPVRPHAPNHSNNWPACPATRQASHEASHAVVVVLEIAGAVSILAAFTLGQLRLLDQHSLAYLLLNLVGSAVLAVLAFAEERWGFLLLEGVWSIVSAVSLVGLLRRGQEGAGHS